MKRKLHILAITALLGMAAATPVAAQDPHAHHHHAQPNAAAKPEGATPTRLEPPDVMVVDQDGRQRRFVSDLLQGRTVAIHFVFTTCTTICPPLAATFAQVQKQAGERMGRDFHLISISVDPVTDTPERLKAWGAKFGAGSHWTMVTGEKQEIDRLLKALGGFTARIEDHTPLLLIGNQSTGSWTRAYGLAPPATIIKLLEDAAGTSARHDQQETEPR